MHRLPATVSTFFTEDASGVRPGMGWGTDWNTSATCMPGKIVLLALAMYSFPFFDLELYGHVGMHYMPLHAQVSLPGWQCRL